VTRLRAGRPSSDLRCGQGFILFATVFRPALIPTQPPIQLISGALSPGVKQLGRGAYHSLHLVSSLRLCGAIPPLFHKSSWRRNSLSKGRTYYYCLFKIHGSRVCISNVYTLAQVNSLRFAVVLRVFSFQLYKLPHFTWIKPKMKYIVRVVSMLFLSLTMPIKI
jgi:hypothetical protein